MQEVLLMELLADNRVISYDAEATPRDLSLRAGNGGRADVCFETSNSARVRLQDVSLRFTMPAGAYDYLIPHGAGRWLLTVNTVCETKLMFGPLKGQVDVDAPWQAENCDYISIVFHPGAEGTCEFAIEEFCVEWKERAHEGTFEECVSRAERGFADWMKEMPGVPAPYVAARELACYVMWSCVVGPEGHLSRPSVFASKNGMIGIWSWDHCFHALALAEAHPQLAWDQIMVLFDRQDETGVLPDLMNDRLISWSFCKPPVHGWLLSRLLHNSNLITPERLEEIYLPLSRWTNWWFEYRDDDQDGIPHCHHGNDSGWDNSTVFALGPPVESPEISAYLVLQMAFLAEAAKRLGRPQEASQWQASADALTGKLLQHFWRGDHFVAVESSGHTDIESESLQLYLPLILGKRLPEAVCTHLIQNLKKAGRFLTAHGFATESLTSTYYRARGYWRGPIWAAPTLILVDALMACGEPQFAAEIRQRFVDLVARHGFAENFDAQTGQGYHDFHFSWTAGIWLTLAHEMESQNL